MKENLVFLEIAAKFAPCGFCYFVLSMAFFGGSVVNYINNRLPWESVVTRLECGVSNIYLRTSSPHLGSRV